MKRWLQTLVIYSPAIVLVAAGVAVLMLVPLYTYSGPSGPGVGCGGTTPGAYACPVVYAGTSTLNLTGPLLLLGAGVYALAALVFTLLFRGKARPGMRLPARARTEPRERCRDAPATIRRYEPRPPRRRYEPGRLGHA